MARTGVRVDETTPAAFLSYAHHDDEHDRGKITAFRRELEGEVRAQTGRRDVRIFQDRDDIAWGEAWKERIDSSLDAVTFLVPVLTPSFLASIQCRREFRRFLDRERRLDRKDLILPVYWIESPVLERPARHTADDLASELAARQYADWRELRFQDLGEPAARRALATLAAHIRDALDPADQAARSVEAIHESVMQVVHRAVDDVEGPDLDAVDLVNILVDVVRDAAWLSEDEVMSLRWISQSRLDRPPGAPRESKSSTPDIPGEVEPANADSFRSRALAVVEKTVRSTVAASGDSSVAGILVSTVRGICILSDPARDGDPGAIVARLRMAVERRFGILRESVERVEREDRETVERAVAANAEAHRAAHQQRDEALRRLHEVTLQRDEFEHQIHESAAAARQREAVERRLAEVRLAVDEHEAVVADLRTQLDAQRNQARDRMAQLEGELHRRRLVENSQSNDVDHLGLDGGTAPPGAAEQVPDELHTASDPARPDTSSAVSRAERTGEADAPVRSRGPAAREAAPDDDSGDGGGRWAGKVLHQEAHTSDHAGRPSVAQRGGAAAPHAPTIYVEDRVGTIVAAAISISIWIVPWVSRFFVDYAEWATFLGMIVSVIFGLGALLFISMSCWPDYLSFGGERIGLRVAGTKYHVRWEDVSAIYLHGKLLQVDLSNDASLTPYEGRSWPPRIDRETTAKTRLVVCDLSLFRGASVSNIATAVRTFAGSVPIGSVVFTRCSPPTGPKASLPSGLRIGVIRLLATGRKVWSNIRGE